ncbi:hypothetical protein ACF1E9_08590 [Streptomyces roseolus]|uniref:hypothetical protein n=1 Tax=Streptomyces roseolus TaxID=67358 RepID=UPI0036F4C4D3
MGESVSVRCPECRRSHAYAPPAFPCPCGTPVAPRVDPDATAEPVRHRTWQDQWVTVRCGACGREGEWPRPELGCACGTVLRIPVAPAPGRTGPGTTVPPPPRPDPAEGYRPEEGHGSGRRHGSGEGYDSERRGPGEGYGSGRKHGPEEGYGSEARGPVHHAPDDSAGPAPAPYPPGGFPGPASDGFPGAAPDGPGPGPDRPDRPGPFADPDDGAGEGWGPGPVSDWFGASPRSFAERYPAHIPPPPTVPRPSPGRGVYRPVTIRTARDAVAAAATYLHWLGFREIVQPEDRHTPGVDLRGDGLVAQVDPSTRPAGLRAVECLWLNGLGASSVSVFFSLAGYTPEARSRAAEIGLPLYVLDLTGTPQPVNDAADELTSGGAG